ncbi:MAG: OsmC family protein [Thermoplasmata archaeon]
MTEHQYSSVVRWTGNLGKGTSEYRAYSRDHVIQFSGKPDLGGSSGLAPLSDKSRYNPDELLVASLSACHMLWYLHLCAVNGVVVSEYVDKAAGVMRTDADGGGRFVQVTLHPQVTILQGDEQRAMDLHAEAHRKCFIANSVNFPVEHQAVIRSAAHRTTAPLSGA